MKRLFGRKTGRTMLSALTVLGLTNTACHDDSSSLPYYRSATMTPEWLSDREAASPAMHHVANFRLTDQAGQTVTEARLGGRVTVVGFFFTRCGDVCPTTTRNLARLLHDLSSDEHIQVLSHSVAPERDSVVALKAFADSHGIVDPRWHLLTGTVDDVFRLARESYFVRLGSDSTYGVASIAHTESVLLVDGCGRLRGVYAGTLMLEMQRLEEDIISLERTNCTGTKLSKS